MNYVQGKFKHYNPPLILSSEEDHERVPKAMILGHKDRDDPQAPLQ